ncbi:MAG: hypothetical protein JXR30_03435, partial [Alphaproteobacteria bacterium]|nr:hypothetical protein [Alphaproteobacteria bacterium]
ETDLLFGNGSTAMMTFDNMTGADSISGRFQESSTGEVRENAVDRTQKKFEGADIDTLRNNVGQDMYQGY